MITLKFFMQRLTSFSQYSFTGVLIGQINSKFCNEFIFTFTVWKTKKNTLVPCAVKEDPDQPSHLSDHSLHFLPAESMDRIYKTHGVLITLCNVPVDLGVCCLHLTYGPFSHVHYMYKPIYLDKVATYTSCEGRTDDSPWPSILFIQFFFAARTWASYKQQQ